jgi:hypothetical protein
MRSWPVRVASSRRRVIHGGHAAAVAGGQRQLQAAGGVGDKVEGVEGLGPEPGGIGVEHALAQGAATQQCHCGAPGDGAGGEVTSGEAATDDGDVLALEVHAAEVDVVGVLEPPWWDGESIERPAGDAPSCRVDREHHVPCRQPGAVTEDQHRAMPARLDPPDLRRHDVLGEVGVGHELRAVTLEGRGSRQTVGQAAVELVLACPHAELVGIAARMVHSR